MRAIIAKKIMTLDEAAKLTEYPFFAQAQDGRIYAIVPFIFTVAIVGPIDEYGYEERWCYHRLVDALGALNDWRKLDFVGEPEGWHRHLPSGRRKNPDGSTEIRY